MAFSLMELPYSRDALEPHMSGNTLDYHYGKHHQTYVNKLNGLVEGSQYAEMSLEEVVRASAEAGDTGVFNNAAQVVNHDFLWHSLSPNGGGTPDGELGAAIDAAFGSFDGFRTAFAAAAAGQFGSGWAWLVAEGDTLKIVTTGNADNPMLQGQTPLITLDVWEHAYYLDFQNDRPGYVQSFLDNLANWDFAAKNFAAA